MRQQLQLRLVEWIAPDGGKSRFCQIISLPELATGNLGRYFLSNSMKGINKMSKSRLCRDLLFISTSLYSGCFKIELPIAYCLLPVACCLLPVPEREHYHFRSEIPSIYFSTNTTASFASLTSCTRKMFAPFNRAIVLSAVVPFNDSSTGIASVL